MSSIHPKVSCSKCLFSLCFLALLSTNLTEFDRVELFILLIVCRRLSTLHFQLLLRNRISDSFQIWQASTLGGSISDLFISCQNLKFYIFVEYFCNFWSKFIFSTSSSKPRENIFKFEYRYLDWFCHIFSFLIINSELMFLTIFQNVGTFHYTAEFISQ